MPEFEDARPRKSQRSNEIYRPGRRSRSGSRRGSGKSGSTNRTAPGNSSGRVSRKSEGPGRDESFFEMLSGFFRALFRRKKKRVSGSSSRRSNGGGRTRGPVSGESGGRLSGQRRPRRSQRRKDADGGGKAEGRAKQHPAAGEVPEVSEVSTRYPRGSSRDMRNAPGKKSRRGRGGSSSAARGGAD